MKDLPEASKARVEKRIAKLVGQRQEAVELAETEKVRADEAEAREETLRQELVEAKAGNQRSEAGGQGSELLSAESEAEIVAYEAELTRLEDFIDEHIDEGYTPDDPDKKSYTPAELRKMQRDLSRKRATLIPKAREVLKKRTKANAEAKTLYPDLFKPSSELGVKAAAILREIPALKAMPNAMIFIGDALTREAERAKPPKKVEAPKKKPPVVPAPAAAPKKPTETPPEKSKVNMEKVQESGGDAESITDAVEALGLA